MVALGGGWLWLRDSHHTRIHVVDRIPVAVVVGSGQRIAVASDGTLLRDVTPSSALPTLAVRVLPAGSRVTGSHALAVLAVLGAAPDQLLSHVAGATENAVHGVVVNLRSGPSLYFGDSQQLSDKWTAASAVLADSASGGAAYIDVTNPRRPAAGAGGPAAPSVSSGTAASSPGAATIAASSAGGAPTTALGSTGGAPATSGG